MGNLNNGTYPVGLSFGPGPVAPGQVVVMNYFIVNSGHNPPSDVQTALTNAGNTAATAAGTAVGTAIGTVIFPGVGGLIGSALGALAGWLSGVIFGTIFADCDGPVAAEQEVFSYSDLVNDTTAGKTFTQSTRNAGSNSPSGCGSNSLYVVNWHVTPQRNVRAFQALISDSISVGTSNVTEILVLGDNGNLWLEHAPFGKVPPARQQVDQTVLTFQGLTDGSGNIYVLGTDGDLWLSKPPFGKVPPARQFVDEDVQSFQAIDSSHVFVLGRNGNLWFEQAPFPASGVPTNRQQVVAWSGVLAFEALDASTVLVLDSTHDLWMVEAPFANNTGQLVDADVLAFQGSGANVYVLGMNGNLWLEQPPFGHVPPARQQVDETVQAFRALFTGPVLVLGDNGNLWLEQGPFGKVPPTRQQVDATVWAFQGLNGTTQTNPVVLVLGDNGNLWLENAPYGKVPPGRQQVDADVV
jgi:hypothetical protein